MCHYRSLPEEKVSKCFAELPPTFVKGIPCYIKSIQLYIHMPPLSSLNLAKYKILEVFVSSLNGGHGKVLN